MRYFFLLISCLGICASIQAQELNCNVRIQTPKLQQADPTIFKTLENEIFEFMNNRKWTEDAFLQDEKIECSFNINLVEELSNTRFTAEVTIQAIRPVHNSNYKTVVFEHKDNDWDFDYAQYQPLDFDINSYQSNLTSLLGYYAYVILGFDYDTFSQEGGNAYFVKAQTVINNAQNSGREGWRAFESTRNRYWMVENALSSKFKSLRSAYYTYHREGLDVMYNNLTEGRKKVAAAIATIESSHRNNPNSMIVKMLANAKSDEIIKIFGDGSVPPMEKTKVVNALVIIDPANAQKFQAINSKGGSSIRGNTTPRRGGG